MSKKLQEDKSSILNSREHLFTILTAIIKKNGGELRLSDTEIESVTKGDLVSLSYNPNTYELILTVNHADNSSALKISKNTNREDN